MEVCREVQGQRWSKVEKGIRVDRANATLYLFFRRCKCGFPGFLVVAHVDECASMHVSGANELVEPTSPLSHCGSVWPPQLCHFLVRQKINESISNVNRGP